MTGLGIFFIILGVGSFLLPFFGIQFKLVSIFGPYQLAAQIAAIVIGAGLVLLGRRR